LVSILAGRKQNLHLSEAGVVGPALATFIAALAVRYRLSRAKIAELLVTWLYRKAPAVGTARPVRPVSPFFSPKEIMSPG
jgi:transposase